MRKIMDDPSFIKAYLDGDFLKRDELRPARLQLELLKAELSQQEHDIISTICVFGSARTPDEDTARRDVEEARRHVESNPDDAAAAAQLCRAERDLKNSRYYEEARKLGSIVSSTCQMQGRCEFVIVTGGGPGIMEAANRGAHEVGSKSVGLNISLPYEQYPNPYVTPGLCFNFHYFAIRKMHFLMRAKALIAFPGGFGTMDELFETLTLVQTEKIKRVPIVLFGRDFWEEVINFKALAREGTISPEDIDLFEYAETAQEAWDIISRFYALEA